jgi:hypothetical protein
MLFGRKPFGEGKTQDKVLAEGTILQAYQVILLVSVFKTL